jgi:hypothetical protein
MILMLRWSGSGAKYLTHDGQSWPISTTERGSKAENSLQDDDANGSIQFCNPKMDSEKGGSGTGE